MESKSMQQSSCISRAHNDKRFCGMYISSEHTHIRLRSSVLLLSLKCKLNARAVSWENRLSNQHGSSNTRVWLYGILDEWNQLIEPNFFTAIFAVWKAFQCTYNGTFVRLGNVFLKNFWLDILYKLKHYLESMVSSQIFSFRTIKTFN